ncbi:hypothetical protein BDV25DRAFT_151074 [Aspergillus avenaceus]|uniref:Uncharacterized protein n=1 Tax=Aspergillus avenaceus TaxID=36643 RepID=A0A5N6U1A9_ASPAV|nr:hypothetical protein BDV25DRAFT_151074 [Aspergillus avenaceus]
MMRERIVVRSTFYHVGSTTPEQLLVSRLKSAAKKVTRDVEVLFSNDLIKDLIYDEASINDHNISEILSIIDEGRDNIIQSFGTTSLRCISYLILRPNVETYQDKGLYLLLDASLSNVERNQDGEIGSGVSSEIGASLQQRLISVLYQLFIDENQYNAHRRLAGKLLTELMLESQDGGNLLARFQEPTLSR